MGKERGGLRMDGRKEGRKGEGRWDAVEGVRVGWDGDGLLEGRCEGWRSYTRVEERRWGAGPVICGSVRIWGLGKHEVK